MPDYDAIHFNPPAPIVNAILRHPGNGATVPNVQLLLDTGADVTLLPRFAVERVGVPRRAHEAYEIMGFDGTTSFASVVTAELIVLDHAFRGRFLMIDQDRGILGRDVINQFALLLDGPRRQWSKHGP